MTKNLKKRQLTKERLKNAFMNIYEKKSYIKITVNDICREAGLYRGTFYNYYENIDSLLRETEDQIIEELREYSTCFHTVNIKELLTWNDKIYNIYYNLMNYVYVNKKHMLIFLSPNADPYFVNKYKKVICEDYELTFKQNGAAVSGANRIILNHLAAGIIQAQYTWLKNEDLSVAEMAALIYRINNANLSLIRIN